MAAMVAAIGKRAQIGARERRLTMGDHARSPFRTMRDLCEKLSGEDHELWLKAEKELLRLGPKNFFATIDRTKEIYDEVTALKARLSAVGLKHTVDFSTTPKVPDGFCYHKEDQIKSRFTGKVEIYTAHDVRKIISPYWFPGQGCLDGNEFPRKLEGKLVLPSHLLDLLMDHNELIPEELKTFGMIHFWGSIFWCRGTRYVRFINWNMGRWLSGCHNLCPAWPGTGPAACLAEGIAT